MYRFIVLMLCACSVFAQDNKNNADQPLDLQEFVITGKTNAEIKGGLKMKPNKPGVLTKAELDSINTDVKTPIPLLPSIPLPASPLQSYAVNGYVMGEFGMFITPILKAGYSSNYGGYAIDVFGNYEGSQGHIDNADFTKMGLHVHASYDAPKKFVFFGGSRTETGLSYSSSRYQLFGADRDNIVQRSIDNLGAIVDVKGSIGAYAYTMGAQWNMLHLGTDSLSLTDSRIQGQAQVSTMMYGMNMSGSLLLDIHSYGDASYNFMETGVNGVWSEGDMSLSWGAGLQAAKNSQDIQFGALSVKGTIEYRLSQEFTSSLDLSSGLNNTSLAELLKSNPYLVHMPVISFRRDDIRITPMMQWHPNLDIHASIKASYQTSSNIPVMLPNSLESGKFQGFSIAYVSGSIFDIHVEGQWKQSQSTMFSGTIRQTITTLADSGTTLPMIAPISIGLHYEQTWMKQLQSTLTIDYVAPRIATLSQEVELPSYILANIRVAYSIQKDLEAYLRVDNLLNSSIYVWNKFRERGTFFALGARYLF